MRCKGKVAIVTGAAGNGMGRSIALTLAREGANVVVNYRASEESADSIVDYLEGQGRNAIAVQADVFAQEGCQNLVNETVAQFGRVDICIVGPGGGWHPEPPKSLDPAAALEDVRQELSPAYAYNVGKAARVQALLLAHKQAWRAGVTVNVVAPGPVPAVESLEEAVELCDRGAAWQQRTNVTPQDVAEGVAFLCSEDGRFVTGCVLPYLFHG